MTTSEALKLVEILAWPTIAVLAIYVLHPHLSKLLSGSKVKLSIAGQSIETTLPELKQILEEQAGEPLSPQQRAFLASLVNEGSRPYKDGVTTSEERKFLRPLRNNGLILTVPRNSFLTHATAIEVSALGRLYLRSTSATPSK